jgi:hypothetical protein
LNPAKRETLVQEMDSTFVRSHSWSEERRTYFELLHRLLARGTSTAASRKGECKTQ